MNNQNPEISLYEMDIRVLADYITQTTTTLSLYGLFVIHFRRASMDKSTSVTVDV